MAHYAKVENGIVTKVIVAEADYFDTFVDDSPGKWIQTSYNTYGGVHSDGGTPLRKNFAGVGYTYDSTRDAFIPQLVFGSPQLHTQMMVRFTHGMKKINNGSSQTKYV